VKTKVKKQTKQFIHQTALSFEFQNFTASKEQRVTSNNIFHLNACLNIATLEEDSTGRAS
jgi:hypothetical protein